MLFKVTDETGHSARGVAVAHRRDPPVCGARVAERDPNGAENEEHRWACIVPGDPAQHAYEDDEHGKAVD